MDNTLYARINGAWAQVEATNSFETVLITLLPNNDEILGASILVTDDNGNSLLNATWEGAEIVLQVEEGTNYTIKAGDISGYITPSAVTYNAVKGATRGVSMSYIASSLTVNIASNQDDDSFINDIKAVVSYGTTSVNVGNGDTIDLPTNTDVTITFPDVSDYKTPDVISFNHTSGKIVKVGTYQTELLTVALSANTGGSVVGQVVTINGVNHTWDGTDIKQKIPFGVSYSISVNEKNGFVTPSPINLIANTAKRNVSIVYYYRLGSLTPSTGIYIQDTEGYFLTIDEWGNTGGLTPNGVAVITDNCSFVIAKDYVRGPLSTDVSVHPDLPEFKLKDNAATDYNGQSNTEKFVLAYGDNTEHIAGKCKNYIFPNGKNGYLASFGEVQAIIDNKNAINSAFAAFVEYGASLDYLTLWCSTYGGSDSGSDMLGWYYVVTDGVWYHDDASQSYNARPLQKL